MVGEQPEPTTFKIVERPARPIWNGAQISGVKTKC